MMRKGEGIQNKGWMCGLDIYFEQMGENGHGRVNREALREMLKFYYVTRTV